MYINANRNTTGYSELLEVSRASRSLLSEQLSVLQTIAAAMCVPRDGQSNRCDVLTVAKQTTWEYSSENGTRQGALKLFERFGIVPSKGRHGKLGVPYADLPSVIRTINEGLRKDRVEKRKARDA